MRDVQRESMMRLVARLGELQRQRRFAERDQRPAAIVAHLEKQIAEVRAEIDCHQI